MADNKAIKSDATATILTAGTKEVTFSGDTIDIQLVELVAVGGAEGSRTITEISSETDGLLVNLGANNDVTVTSGSVVLGAGTAEFGKLAAGTAVIGHVIVDTAPTTAVTGPLTDTELRAVAVPVSGTVTANLGTIAGVATETTLSTLDGKVTACNTGAVVISSGTVTAVTAITNALPAGTNLIGDVGMQPRTTGGVTTYHLVSAATTNLTNIKASAGQLYGWYIYNSNAAARKLCFHNTAGTPTAGASIYFSLVIPATSGANVFLPHGIAFSTGIGISTVTGLADSDTAAVALNDLIINLWYA